MNQSFELSAPVLADLKYSEEEVSCIIQTLKRGNFSYKPKMSYPEISGNEEWLHDSASGIDVPVLWTPDDGDAARTVLLLAQDPLRDDDYWDGLYCSEACREGEHNLSVIIGTPYALHLNEKTMNSKMLSTGKRKRWIINIYRKLIEAIVLKGYNVYCTDIFKYYFKGHSLDIADFDKQILNAEIGRLEKFGLSHIICLGHKAQGAINEISFSDNVEIIKSLHPRARNWNVYGDQKWTDDEKVKYIVEKVG